MKKRISGLDVHYNLRNRNWHFRIRSKMFPELSEIGKYFNEMFTFRWEEYKRNGSALVVNPSRRRKKFVDDEGYVNKPLDFEILGNISAFGIYEASRLAVFEKFLRRSSYIYLHVQAPDETCEEYLNPEKEISSFKVQSPVVSGVSKVVKIGVRSIFELIKGSRVQIPNLCVKAVHSLLTLLEGLELEALSDEPVDIIDDIFSVLLCLVKECLNEKDTEEHPDMNRIGEISSACLLSFTIIRGDIGKILKAINIILTSKYSIYHKMLLPNAVIELQKNIQSIITGNLKYPNWFSHGVAKSSCISTFRLRFPLENIEKVSLKMKNVACDGSFLYLYTTFGLYKIGTGYNSTIPRNIYAYNPAFFGQERGWIGYMKETLYFIMIKSKGINEIYKVNTITLELQNIIRIDVNLVNLSAGILFVDGDFMCLMFSPAENILTIRYLELSDDKIFIPRADLNLTLTKKYFKLFGISCSNEEIILSGETLGVKEQLIAFACGKEFSLLQTNSGRVFYNNKLGNQRVRIPVSRNLHNWMELLCPKLTIVKQCVIGNEGSIGLLVYNDGSVYFIGFAKRGEDGENGVVRRQCNQIKPRRMARMEGNFVTYAACNNGSTALVTDKGELFMFGKDAIHCEAGSGFVSDLKNIRVRQVALGKVHVMVLTDKGFVYTFGYNGRGQCGRHSGSDQCDTYVEVPVEDNGSSGSSDESYSDVICPKGTHMFKQDKCMICPTCHQCTGYGAGCLASNEENREPGEECGCGDGDSGCAKCCICKVCAFEEDPEQKLEEDNDIDDLIKINLFGVVYGQNGESGGSLNKEIEMDAISSKELKSKGLVKFNNANNILLNDSTNMVYLSPARVNFRTNVPAIQICAGLYHSVVLLENGEVYTFGSNAFGQLGVSDVNHVGPVRANLPPVIVQIAAGSNHTVALTSTGEIFGFGNNTGYHVGDNAVPIVSAEGSSWSCIPNLIPLIGAQYHEKAVGIGASGDLTYIQVDKSFISSTTLKKSALIAEKNHLLLLPVKSGYENSKPFESIAIEKTSGNFKTFHGPNHVDFSDCVVCFDSVYNVLWSVNETSDKENPDYSVAISCYNVIAGDVRDEFSSPNILDCELAVPVIPLRSLPCYQTAIHVLACLDMIARARTKTDALMSLCAEQKRVINAKYLRKEDFSVVNRFQALGNSWTYNTHNAVEAIRFSSDTDILLGGIGLYGGRGHYHATVKLFDTESKSYVDPKDSQLILDSNEIVYECSLKQIYSFMFEEPVFLQAGRWYIIWAQIKGSPSDCGSSGQTYVVTDDEVVFQFKSSLFSNNGTNVSSGQIPQFLYKILQPEFIVATNLENPVFPIAQILSKKFSHTISEDGFKSLIDLLAWCWEAFKTKYSEISNLMYSPLLLEFARQFDRLVYINQACQQLIRAFIFEMYPDDCRVRERRSHTNYAIAELVGNVRDLLQYILSDPFLFENFFPKREKEGRVNVFFKLVNHMLKECSDTFIACFYVFYPTPALKWLYLNHLLNFKGENEHANDFLLVSTLSSLYESTCHLKSIFPILLGSYDLNQLHAHNKSSNAPLCFNNYYHVLAETLTVKTEPAMHGISCSWLYIVDKLLKLASQSGKENRRGVESDWDPNIALNSCHVLSKLVAEMSAEAMGINDDVQKRKEQMLLISPIRFRRVNANKTWNTGNGSPDAICFTVNKSGIVVVGVGVFGGSGNYDYEIELMEEVAASKEKNTSDYNLSNPHTQWKCIALCRGSFGSADYNGKDIVELNFEYPAKIRENTKCVIKLRLRGNRTNNGELGQALVTGPDHTVFTFVNTDISFNGTSISRGQLPYIIYYKCPERSEEEFKQKLSLENQAREAVLSISSRIFSEVKVILIKANKLPNYADAVDILSKMPFIKVLVPLLVTHLSPIVAIDPKIACKVLKCIENVLPSVCIINRHVICNPRKIINTSGNSATQMTANMITTSSHYSMVESDHPYKRATVSKYTVEFPDTVLWLSLEFDPRCGTTQEEDVLKIYIPHDTSTPNGRIRKVYKPLPKTYGNNKNSWPGTAIILPGNEVIFSLETASKYSLHDRGTTFGFKCTVIGFETINIHGFPRLELELNSLACRCASYLIKKKILYNLNEDEFSAEAVNLEIAEIEYKTYPRILNRGMNLYRDEIAKKYYSYVKTSENDNGSDLLDPAYAKFSSGELNERNFLSDFIAYKADTAGGRLARWLQPDAFVDVDRCEVILPRAKIKCGWPTSLAIVIRDQYGDIVQVPDLLVKLICTPLVKVYPPCTRIVKEEEKDGVRKLDYSFPYKPVTSNQVRYTPITFMKEYCDYSFEEIRYATPSTPLEGEQLSVLSNHNGVFTANWTPTEVGLYSVNVNIDGYITDKLDVKIDVKMPPFGLTPPMYNESLTVAYVEKKLRFTKKFSAGLRVRAQPSLQAEQIGIITQEGVIVYSDEVENEDGIWVKLTHDCTTHYCKQLFPEAWGLKYNKHYESEFLFSFTDKYYNESVVKVNMATSSDNEMKVYRVVKCGISGHNIRAYPSLKAPTVGMVFIEQNIISDDQVFNKEGMWIKFEKGALGKLDKNLLQCDSVWSLAVDKSQIIYLKSDADFQKDNQGRKSCNGGTPCKSGTRFEDDDQEHMERSRLNNRNMVNCNIPPTPKKQRQCNVVELERTYSSSGGSLNTSSYLAHSSSNCSMNSGSGGGSESPQFDSFIEKLERATNECLAFGSGSSGAVSSGYQASLETSSDSNVIRKSPNYYSEVKKQPLFTHNGTQTSPRIYIRLSSPKRQENIDDMMTSSFSPCPTSASNSKVKKETDSSLQVLETETYFEDSVMRIETTMDMLRTNLATECDYIIENMNSGDDENNYEDGEKVVISKEKSNGELLDNGNEKYFSSEAHFELKGDLESPNSSFVSRLKNKDTTSICDASGDIKFEKLNKSEIQYKIGIRPSIAEALRAIFAAFLWHEDVVHDAMTCASFLKFHPNLRKDKEMVVKREYKRCKEATSRYSVEVGLSGNSHHPIKPSTMKSLPSSIKPLTAITSDRGEDTITRLPPTALEFMVALWNEITNKCLQLFSRSTNYTTVQKCCYANENQEKNSSKSSRIDEDDKKYVSKLVSDFYKKFGSEEVCDLCNTKFPFPVTYHMRNAHKGCGKLTITKGYTVNGKYSCKLKGNCGEGGRKNCPWYVLCDTCREKYLTMKKKSNSFIGFSTVNAEMVPEQVCAETHLLMRENALFALELSGNYYNAMPTIRSFPRLQTFGCLPSFGVDSDMIPSEVNSFTVEFEKKIRGERKDADSEKEEIVNVVNSFQRSVSMIGHTQWRIEEDENEDETRKGDVVCRNKRYSVTYELESSSIPFAAQSSPKLEALVKDIKSSASSESENNGKHERPIMAFMSEYHNLPNLRRAIKLMIRKSIYKNYGLRAMDWLLHTVTSPTALHDIMWWFVHSFSVPLQTDDAPNEDGEWNDEFDLTRICEHPLVDMALAGEARQYIPSYFHSLLQTIADLMLIFPLGSPLQQMAIKCWGFKFTQSDYNFLHRSKLFVNIGKILSRSESDDEQEHGSGSVCESHTSTITGSGNYVEVLRDVTSHVSISVSSQPHLISNLIDNSTETYWESGEEDKRKMKTITISCPPEVNPNIVYLHADNTRDTNHKLLSVMILTGTYADSPKKLKSVNLDSDYCGWITRFIPEPNQRVIRIECKGDSVLRVRQIKVSGEIDGEAPQILRTPCSVVSQQRQCEYETLKIFRLIIFQVFGELIGNFQGDDRRSNEERGSSDLKEHMVGILFSRRKLNNLQKQVCTHIVQTIKRETYVIKEEWERLTNTFVPETDSDIQYEVKDSYCFEMLCMVSALSGSHVGRAYLAKQHDLVSDLLVLLHVGTTRLQRQVVLLLRRVLPEISPQVLAEIMKIRSLPLVDFRVLVNGVSSAFNLSKRGILDAFLSVVAKNLSVQMKSKSGSNVKYASKIVYMSDYIHSECVESDRWYFKGSVSKELSIEVDILLKDMSAGKISFEWQEMTKAAIAENILNLANLSKVTKDRFHSLKYPIFWIGLASLSAIDADHVEKLSSTNWKSETGDDPRPLCDNHDDDKTLAVMQCNVCGVLCLECDRFLHLSRKTRLHQRKVCKEEEEAIKVDLHEGCGRVKLFWLLALVDSNTFKGVIEFRENSQSTSGSGKGANHELCRFCGRNSDKISQYGTCCDEECLQHESNVCSKVHPCGHMCGGIKDEEKCLPCLQGCSSSNLTLKQDADDMCMICFTEALSAAPSVQLECGHVFHYHCCESVLLRLWPGPRVTFNFQQCPICKRSIYHESLKELLSPIWDLMKEVRKKALMRLEYEGCPSNCDDPAGYALEKYAYYVCFKCKKAYYGGEARCEAEIDNLDFNPEELICGGCSDVSGARVCPKHGTDFLEYKCRYCCSLAVYFCFGTTHFCNACHEDFQKVIYMTSAELPSCPAGPKGSSLEMEECPLHIKHPPTGEEFALGCGVCRTGRSF